MVSRSGAEVRVFGERHAGAFPPHVFRHDELPASPKKADTKTSARRCLKGPRRAFMKPGAGALV